MTVSRRLVSGESHGYHLMCLDIHFDTRGSLTPPVRDSGEEFAIDGGFDEPIFIDFEMVFFATSMVYSQLSPSYPSKAPIIDTVGSLGYTVARTLPTQITKMERHFDSEEGAFGAGLPFVLVVDDAPGEHPDPLTVQAFIVPVGTAVKLNRGIWHDACLGLSEPTPYYWFAYCANNFLDEWAELPEPIALELSQN